MTSLILYYIIPQRTYKKSAVNFYFLLFLVFSCIVTSLNRAGFGAYQAFSPRYQIYSSLIVLFLYFLLLDLLTGKTTKIKNIALMVFFIICILDYYSAYKMKMVNVKDTQFSLNLGAITHNAKGNPALVFPDQPTAKAIIDESEKTGIYKLPPLSFSDLATAPVTLNLRKETDNINKDWSLKSRNSLLMINNGWAYIEGRNYLNCQTYIILRSKQKQYIFPTYRHFRPDITARFEGHTLDWSGFSLIIDRTKIEDGIYEIGVFIREVTLIKRPYYGLMFTHQFLIQKKGSPLKEVKGKIASI
jgi:hypothetical protein